MKMQKRYYTTLGRTYSMAVLVVLLMSLFSAMAQNAHASTWSGGDRNDSNWTSNGNWKGILGAREYINLVFPAGAERLINFNDFPVNTTFSGLEFTAGGYVINGNQIFLHSNSLVDNPGMLISIPGGLSNQSVFNPNIILADTQTWASHFGFLRLNGVVHLNNKTLTIDTDADGTLILNGLVHGSGNLNKNGLGKLFINGSADTFGTTFLNGGTIEVFGSLGRVSLRGGTLQGIGFVKDILTDVNGPGGTISPGNGANAPGVLRSNGLVSLRSEATLAIDLNGTTQGSQYDSLRVTGSNVDLNGANLDLSLGFTPVVGQQFTIVTQVGTGVITGNFHQGNGIVVNSQAFAISYNANTVVLTALGPFIP